MAPCHALRGVQSRRWNKDRFGFRRGSGARAVPSMCVVEPVCGLGPPWPEKPLRSSLCLSLW
eukprot:405263-Pyramimonas_sp.AAC.1